MVTAAVQAAAAFVAVAAEALKYVFIFFCQSTELDSVSFLCLKRTSSRLQHSPYEAVHS
jgi:hypothetical protein